MGKASSAKKVARAARAGGQKQARQRGNLGFPMLLGAVVVLGLLLVTVAVINSRNVSANTIKPRAQGQGGPSDHWHNAVGIDICGRFQPNLNDKADDKEGVHTHGDGVIHIHPFFLRSAGSRATLARFFDDVDLKVTADAIRMPDGKLYQEGKTTCNGKPGKVSVAYWVNAQTAQGTKPDKVYTSGFGDIRLKNDGGAFTVAFLPEGAPVGPPGTAAKLKELGAADAGASGATTAGSAGGAATTGSAGGLPTGSSGAASTGAAGTGAATSGGAPVTAPPVGGP